MAPNTRRKQQSLRDTSAQTKACSSEPPLNPISRQNWPQDPKTTKQFQKWMTQTESKLLEWVESAQDRAQDLDDRKKISEVTKEIDEAWSEFEPQVDIQTGTIFDPSARSKMLDVMSQRDDIRGRLHKQLGTEERHDEYRWARSAWEDFLYYQNEWNRKRFDPGKDFFLNKADRDAKAATRKTRAVPMSKISTSKGGQPEPSEGCSKAKSVGDTSAASGSENEESGSPDLSDEFLQWQDHIIKLFNKFRLGSRQSIPQIVDPRVAHRYSQSVRGTTNQSSESGKERFQHLESCYPTATGMESRAGEAEDQKNTPEREAGASMEWKIDEKACEELKMEKDEGYLENPFTKALLPAKHVLHHGCLETSFDWPTSFDSPQWGNAVAVTTIRMKHKFEKVESAEKIRDEDREYKLDSKGRKIIEIDERPRYRMAKKKVLRDVFLYDMDEDGKVLGRDRDGEWRGRWDTEEVDEEYFETHGRDQQRVQLPSRRCRKNKFKIVVFPVGKGKPLAELNLRPNRPEKGGKGQELSEDEADDCMKSNRNFPWSGNNNPDQIGARASVEGKEDDEDLESDDEGDIFTMSYLEASNTSNLQEPISRPVESQGEQEEPEQPEEVMPKNA